MWLLLFQLVLQLLYIMHIYDEYRQKVDEIINNVQVVLRTIDIFLPTTRPMNFAQQRVFLYGVVLHTSIYSFFYYLCLHQCVGPQKSSVKKNTISRSCTRVVRPKHTPDTRHYVRVRCVMAGAKNERRFGISHHIRKYYYFFLFYRVMNNGVYYLPRN